MEVNERIAQKAGEMFMQFGIRSVSMDDIAGSLGISKKTIYQYFADKNELVAAVITAKLENVECAAQDFTKEADDAIHEMFITRELMRKQLEHMNPVVVFDLEKFHPEAYEKLQDHKNRFILQAIRRNLEWGIRDGVYRDDMDVDIISKFRLMSMMSVFDLKQFPQTQYSLYKVSHEIIMHFLRGIASRKGLDLIDKYNQETQTK